MCIILYKLNKLYIIYMRECVVLCMVYKGACDIIMLMRIQVLDPTGCDSSGGVTQYLLCLHGSAVPVTSVQRR